MNNNFYAHYMEPFFQLWRHFGFRVAWNEMCFVLERKRHPDDFARRVATFRKYIHIITFLERKYGQIVEKYAKYSSEEWNGEKVREDAPIWVFWMQGFENAPEVVQNCLRSLKLHAGGHPVIELNSENLQEYVDIPEYIWQKYRSGIISSTIFSDTLRFLLLARHGGIWVDACDFFLSDGFFKEAVDYSFYSAKGYDNKLKITRQLWSDGIWACGKGNKYPQLMKDLLLAYWEQENYLIDYFATSCFQNVAYMRLKSLRNMFFAYPSNNTGFCDIRWSFASDYDETQFQTLLRENAVLNLTWKVSSEKTEPSYYQKLLQYNKLQ